jgi:hypothetical protein
MWAGRGMFTKTQMSFNRSILASVDFARIKHIQHQIEPAANFIFRFFENPALCHFLGSSSSILGNLQSADIPSAAQRPKTDTPTPNPLTLPPKRGAYLQK